VTSAASLRHVRPTGAHMTDSTDELRWKKTKIRMFIVACAVATMVLLGVVIRLIS
jgi:hypothetical protein